MTVVWLSSSVLMSRKTISRCCSAVKVLQRHPLVRQRLHIQIVEVLVFAVDAGREHRQLDVQLVDVLFLVVAVHLHHDRRLRPGPLPHRLVFQLDALDLDALDEIHEGFRADDADLFLHCLAPEHPPQAAAERLLRENLARRRERAQSDDRHDVLHVPALAQHHH